MDAVIVIKFIADLDARGWLIEIIAGLEKLLSYLFFGIEKFWVKDLLQQYLLDFNANFIVTDIAAILLKHHRDFGDYFFFLNYLGITFYGFAYFENYIS